MSGKELGTYLVFLATFSFGLELLLLLQLFSSTGFPQSLPLSPLVGLHVY